MTRLSSVTSVWDRVEKIGRNVGSDQIFLRGDSRLRDFNELPHKMRRFWVKGTFWPKCGDVCDPDPRQAEMLKGILKYM